MQDRSVQELLERDAIAAHEQTPLRLECLREGRKPGVGERRAVESSQTLHFAFNPKISTVPKAWMDADPFWAPKPPPPAKPAEKKKE